MKSLRIAVSSGTKTSDSSKKTTFSSVGGVENRPVTHFILRPDVTVTELTEMESMRATLSSNYRCGRDY